MIYDRTEDDVIQAKSIYNNKCRKFQRLTDEEINQLERGTLTINTLNRIENAQSELKTMLTDIGYYNVYRVKNKNWTTVSILKQSDYERILENHQILIDAYFIYTNTPNVPNETLIYSNINDIEKIIVDLNNMVIDMQNNYRECDTFECGEG